MRLDADTDNLLAQPISIHPHCIGRGPEAGPQGKEYLLDGSAYCMDSRGQPQAVAQPYTLAIRGRGDSHQLEYRQDGTANALLTPNGGRGGIGVGAVAQPLVLEDQGGSVMNTRQDGTVGTLRRETHGHEPIVMQPIGLDEEQNSFVDGFGTLKARSAGGGFEGTVMLPSMAVRRLTPVECERLQGFPDGYTNIPWRKSPESPDGPRYKALGNSWAVPVVRWIGKRIDNMIKG
jgi:DNA (cytosine-5)-methyltransferase 1